MKLVVDINSVLYRELVEAAETANCLGEDHAISPTRFAQETLESVLAERRMERINLEKLQRMSA